MFLERSPGIAALQQKGPDQEIQVPGCKPAEQVKGEGKEDDCEKPEKDPGQPLGIRFPDAWATPPANEPAYQGNRVIGGVRIPDATINEKREGKDERLEDHQDP
jgi:hypothetical protein